MTLILICPFNI